MLQESLTRILQVVETLFKNIRITCMMDEFSKDYMLDQAMTSIAAFKEAMRVVNAVHPDKPKRLTPVQKIKHLTKFINDEHDRIMEEYDKCSQV